MYISIYEFFEFCSTRLQKLWIFRDLKTNLKITMW